MKRMREPNPVKVETEFTDAMLTGCGGWSVLARLAKGLGLLKLLSGCVRVRERARGSGGKASSGAAPADPASGAPRGEAGADGSALDAVLREEQLPP